MLTKQFPAVIDNTMRVTYFDCPWQFYGRFVLGRNASATSTHLHAGAAFARGLEVARTHFYALGKPQDEAIAEGMRAAILAYGDHEPSDEAKSLPRVLGALEFYASEWPFATDHIKPLYADENGTSVEFNFVLPLPINHPDTGEPLLYSGRFDLLGQLDRMTVGVDEKTTKQLGASWPLKWKRRSQFTGYMWGARQFGHKIDTFFIRGISFLSKSYGKAEAIVHRSNYEIDLWYEQLLRDVQGMVNDYATGKWSRALNDACSAYSGCQFIDVCCLPDPDEWLETNFVESRWDPTRVF